MSVNVLHLWQCLTSRNVSPLNCQSAEISHLWQPPTHTSGLPCGSSLLLGECLTCTSVPAEKFLTCGSPSPAQLSHLCSSLNCTTLTCGGPSPAQLSHLWKALNLHNCLTCGRPSPAQLPHLWKSLTCTTVSPVEVPHLHNCLTCGSSSPAQPSHLYVSHP